MAPAAALLGRARIILRLFEQLVAQLDSCRRAGARNVHAAYNLGHVSVATGARARAWLLLPLCGGVLESFYVCSNRGRRSLTHAGARARAMIMLHAIWLNLLLQLPRGRAHWLLLPLSWGM